MEIITHVTPRILIFGLGIHLSPRYNPTIAIKVKPIAPKTGGNTVPTIVPIKDQDKIIAIRSPKPILLSPCIAKSVTLSLRGCCETVPSRAIEPAATSSCLVKIGEISPMALSVESSNTSAIFSGSSSLLSWTKNDDTSNPLALEKSLSRSKSS